VHNDLHEVLNALSGQARALFLVVPAVVAIAVLLSGFAQTRFWIELGQAAPRTERFWKSRYIGLGPALGRLFYRSLVLFIAVGSAGIALWMYGGDAMRLLNSDRETLIPWLSSFGKTVGVASCLLAAVLYFCTLLLGKLLFLYHNRMTKEELEAELRSHE
jgi:flagellar biosynthesis protein FlhB